MLHERFLKLKVVQEQERMSSGFLWKEGCLGSEESAVSHEKKNQRLTYRSNSIRSIYTEARHTAHFVVRLSRHGPHPLHSGLFIFSMISRCVHGPVINRRPVRGLPRPLDKVV